MSGSRIVDTCDILKKTGEISFVLAPKEQQPRKLSGKRTVGFKHLESSGFRSPTG